MTTETAPNVSRSRMDRLLHLPWFSWSLASFSAVFLLIGIDAVSVFPRLRSLAVPEYLIGIPVFIFLLLFAVGVLCLVISLATHRTLKRTRPKWLSPLLNLFVGVGLLMTTVSSMVPAVNKARDEAAAAQPWQTVRVPKTALTVSVPAGLIQNPAVDVGMSGLAWSTPNGSRTIVVSAIPKIDAVTESIDQYAAHVGKSFLSDVAGATRLENESTAPNHSKYIRQTYVFPDGALKAMALLEFQEVGQYIVELRFIGTPSQFETWTDEIDRVTASIAEVISD